MPQVLTMTPKPGESNQQFAARIAAQADKFFGGSPQPVDGKPSDETSPATDVSAAPEEPAPPA